MKTALIVACLVLSLASVAVADCPKGSWPRNMYSGPGGGLYTGPGGGMFAGPGIFCGRFPPWPVFLAYLADNGFDEEAELIRSVYLQLEPS